MSEARLEIEDAVMEKIKSRRAAGRKKYGTTMERTDLSRRQWLQHAQEEAMDLAIYLERLMREEEPAHLFPCNVHHAIFLGQFCPLCDREARDPVVQRWQHAGIYHTCSQTVMGANDGCLGCEAERIQRETTEVSNG